MRINKDGLITFDETNDKSDENQEGFEINYAESLDLDEFVQIGDKAFSIKELENLLGSTSHYHKLYALRLIKTCLEVTFDSERDQEHYIWEYILNEEYTHLVRHIEMCG